MDEATGYACNCGLWFPATLSGAWAAKLHAEDECHRLRGLRPPSGARAKPGLRPARGSSASP